MTTHAPFPSIWSFLRLELISRSDKTETKHADRENSAEYKRAERDCVRDTVWSNPEAFSGDLDILALADGYRGKF